MRASRYFLPTLREEPSDAEVISHRLMARAGLIRRAAAGVYTYLPLGLRVHEKISQIVREEMNAIGGIEVLMPALVPKELLDETGRSAVDVLFALKDRNGRDFFLGFTHEEVVTDVVRTYVSSWKQLPLILYQIQTKFRDEPRPRGGLIRGREFTMKDAYSFDYDEAGEDRAFHLHRAAYERIFQRCGLDYVVVDADSGAIGGSYSSEFMVLAESGEDTVLRCDRCGYGANAEKGAVGYQNLANPLPAGPPETAAPGSEVVATPGAHTVAQVSAFLGVPAEKIIKTIIVRAGEEVVAALVRGDRELQPLKLATLLGTPCELADAGTIERVTHAPVGFAGPVGLDGVRIVADLELRGSYEMVTGANANDAHRTGVTPELDFAVHQWADIRVAVAGDPCPQPGCGGRYLDAHGIEVAHIFKLGTKYSTDMRAQVQTEQGRNLDVIMGCYGLGVSRTMAAAVEAHHDADGIRWPVSIAPFEVVLILVNPKDEVQRSAAETLYEQLVSAGVEVLFDDRDERSGVKFKDADLIGYPIRLVVGRGAAQGAVELGLRRDKSASREVPLTEAVGAVGALLEAERAAVRPVTPLPAPA